MIHYVQGNIFESEADYITNAVNCLGFMGVGLALAFKRQCSPEYFQSYKQACRDRTLAPGVPRFFFDTTLNKWIVDFPTTTDDPNNFTGSREVIRHGLINLREQIECIPIQSIALPALGCGIGGINFVWLKDVIEFELRDLNYCKIVVYEPR